MEGVRALKLTPGVIVLIERAADAVEVGVAGFGKSVLQVDPPECLVVVVSEYLPADGVGAEVVVVGGRGAQAVAEHGGGRDQLPGGAGGIPGRDGPVDRGEIVRRVLVVRPLGAAYAGSEEV